MIVGPAAAITMVLPSTPPALADAIHWLLFAGAVICVVQRFRMTPPSPDRQRMKWAALAFTTGIIFHAATIRSSIPSR